MTTLTDTPRKTTKGTAFLIEDSAPQDIFTPEDLTEEHLAVGRMVDEFWANEVEPNLPAIREKKPGVAMGVLAEIGGTGSDRDDDPGRIWRHGHGSAVADGDGRTHGERRFLWRLALGAHRHRHAADRLLWK
jgi:hypothetical protein